MATSGNTPTNEGRSGEITYKFGEFLLRPHPGGSGCSCQTGAQSQNSSAPSTVARRQAIFSDFATLS